ncbi:hypothetical protein [Burkholderia sp. Ac-20365]|uniref:hypothetical protein n=1 Tax=Burkholderia sp. Ac-20365 TaxID=2703897 RepID=UPI00197B7E6F|nr:hypothetical protein [Burkholderia sp. Ac-20365]MBN3760932.1 hypothetical protein [Burkholderia sp. Ac-20365]
MNVSTLISTSLLPGVTFDRVARAVTHTLRQASHPEAEAVDEYLCSHEAMQQIDTRSVALLSRSAEDGVSQHTDAATGGALGAEYREHVQAWVAEMIGARFPLVRGFGADLTLQLRKPGRNS